jgi:hypothetical protein
MEALALSPKTGPTRPCSGLDEPLSPELALVDPELAERARLALPDITLTEARIALRLVAELDVAPVRPAPPRVEPEFKRRPPPPAYEEIRRVLQEAPAPAPRAGRRRLRVWFPRLVVLGAAAAAALAVPRVFGGGESPSTSPATRLAPSAGASLTTPTGGGQAAPTRARKQKRTAKTRRAGKTRSAPGRTKPRRHRTSSRLPASAKNRAQPPIPDFVWAPARDARGYKVEFRSGSRVVLQARSKIARLHVPVGKLHPGSYRWIVWRLNRHGVPDGPALIDATVRIR